MPRAQRMASTARPSCPHHRRRLRIITQHRRRTASAQSRHSPPSPGHRASLMDRRPNHPSPATDLDSAATENIEKHLRRLQNTTERRFRRIREEVVFKNGYHPEGSQKRLLKKTHNSWSIPNLSTFKNRQAYFASSPKSLPPSPFQEFADSEFTD